MDLNYFYIKFPEKENCIAFLELIKWNNKPRCPYCQSEQYTNIKSTHRYHCNNCNTSFSVTVGSVFHKTRLDFQKWFFAINLLLNSSNKITSRELGRQIKTTKDTAWRIINEINNSVLKQDSLIQKIIIQDERK